MVPAHLLAQSVTSTSASSTPAPAAASPTAVSTAAASIGGTGGPAEAATYVKGFNASLTTSSQHDSVSGWASLLSPDVSYALNKHLGGDFSFPYYNYLDTFINGGTLLAPTTRLVTVHNVIGDAAANVHFALSPSFMDYVFTATGGFPVGNTQYNLSAEQYTYNINNHFDTSLGIFSPEMELGIGDNSSLLKHRAVKSSDIIGELAYFMAGTSVILPFNLNFTADAYEEMPLSNLNTYQKIRITKKITDIVQTGAGPAEDNGFETDLDIPLASHLVLSGFYDRSLRQHEDTAGFSFTVLLRVPKPAPKAAPAAAH